MGIKSGEWKNTRGRNKQSVPIRKGIQAHYQLIFCNHSIIIFNPVLEGGVEVAAMQKVVGHFLKRKKLSWNNHFICSHVLFARNAMCGNEMCRMYMCRVHSKCAGYMGEPHITNHRYEGPTFLIKKYLIGRYQKESSLWQYHNCGKLVF